jgi:hypothetical protein
MDRLLLTPDEAAALRPCSALVVQSCMSCCAPASCPRCGLVLAGASQQRTCRTSCSNFGPSKETWLHS